MPPEDGTAEGKGTRMREDYNEALKDGTDENSAPETKPETAADEAPAEETAYDILKEADDAEFYALTDKNGSLIWSVLSLLAALASVVAIIFSPTVGIIVAAVAIFLGVISSRKLGFFDRMALFGVIFGIFAIIFGAFSLILDATGILSNL